jgi:transcriptional regulator with XRE-family HTH domain
MKYNEALKRARETKELTQENIAQILNTTRQQISLYETGQREMRASQIITLCTALNITSDYLLGLTNKH